VSSAETVKANVCVVPGVLGSATEMLASGRDTVVESVPTRSVLSTLTDAIVLMFSMLRSTLPVEPKARMNFISVSTAAFVNTLTPVVEVMACPLYFTCMSKVSSALCTWNKQQRTHQDDQRPQQLRVSNVTQTSGSLGDRDVHCPFLS
jgi:hypothetical protein